MMCAAVDMNQQRSESSLASKSTRLCGQLIEDNRSSEKTRDAVVKCNHFSIRGFVAEVRKRDPKLCDPFSPYVSHELPPMVVPKFRWWQCDSCVREAGRSSQGTGEEAQKSVDEVNADIIPLTKQKLEVNIPKKRNIDASTSTDSNDNRNDTPSSTSRADLKGKGKVHVDDEPLPHTGCENGFLKNSLSHDFQQQTIGDEEACGFVDNEGVCRSKFTENGNLESHQMTQTTDLIEIEPSNEQWNHGDGNLVNRKAPEEAHNAGSVTKGIMETRVAGIVDGPSGDGKPRIVSLPDLNEFNVEPSNDNENEPLVSGNSNLSEDDDDYLGAERRKTPKVRLLSELLGQKGNQNDAKLKKKHPSYSTFQGSSAIKSRVCDSPGQSSMNENAKRKRTGSQDDDSRSVEIQVSVNGTKKLRSPQIEVSESESDNDESTEIISDALTKRRNRSTLDKTPLFEKRSKKIKFDHGALPSMSRHKPISKSNQEKGKPFHADIPWKNDSSAQVDDRNMLLNKGKGKMIQSGKEKISLPLCKNHLLKDSTTGKDKEANQNGNERILDEQRRQDGSPQGKGTYLSPDRILIMGTDHTSSDPAKDGIHSHSSRVDSMLLNGGIIKHSEERNTEVANSTLNPPTALFFMGSQYDACTERSSGPKSNSKGRPVWIHETREEGPVVHHTLKQVSNSLTSTKEPTNEVRGRIQDIDINSLPTDDKVSEQSTEDDNQDIPMDIVELMAKNQYERNLVDPKDNRHSSVTVASTSSYGKTVRSNGSNSSTYGADMSKLGQPGFLSLQNPATTNARNNMVNGFEDIGSSRLNLVNLFSDLNQNHVGIRGHVKENQVSAMSLSSSQGHEHVSAFSTFDSTPNNWNRHMTTQRYLPSNFFPPPESYNRYQASSPRPNIDARVWPSGVASRMPLGITNPEMISQSSKSVNKGRIHHQASSILNFSNTSLGKQNMNLSNGYSNGPVESSSSGVGARPSSKQRRGDYPPKTMGSVDLYSNDTIPAMHLLSLMQNRVNIQPAVPLSHDYHQYKQHHETGSIKVGPSSSRQPLLENNGRSSMQESCCHPCYPAIPPGRLFALPFSNGGYGRNAGFIGPIPLTSRGQRNIESSHFTSQGGDHRSQKAVHCDVSRKPGFSSAIGKGNGFARISSPLQGSKDSSNFLFGVTAKRDEKGIKRSLDKVICVVNRNPSEFNDLKELSKYTIRAEDLRPGGPSRAKTSRPKGDGRKLTNKQRSIPSGKDGNLQKKP